MNSNSCQALCDVCGMCFTNKYNLPRHMRIYHGKEKRPKLQCNICDKYVIALDSHMKTHTFTRGKLWCSECDYKCHTRNQLRVHLEGAHKLKIESKELEFKSIEDFLQWKEKIEAEDNVSFIKSSTKENSCYYDCHRSGRAKTKSTGQRLRAGSVKINRTCPACLKVNSLSNGRVCVTFYMTHTGHSLSVGSLRMTATDKAIVADLIQQGLPDNAILKKVRDTIFDGHITRMHLLDRQDIYNVRREYKLDESYAHVDDAVSVEMWVSEQHSLGAHSSVAYYKQQGRDDGKLPCDAFMLIIMTPYQLEMAKKFCKSKVLIDTTHGTNKYKFDLTTLLTVDEFGVGCPVAYCLSTQTDHLAMKVFFEVIKEHTGEIATKVFMSDDCDTYYNAWNEVMGQSEHRLLCSWHIDRAWRRNISSKVKGDIFFKTDVYRALKVLQMQTDTGKFFELANGFLHWCEEDQRTQEFGVYFAKYYVERARMWASCFRIGLGLNTNMYLEASHKTLKYGYLLKKVNNRVDKAIQALLLRTKDLLCERVRRLAKGTLKTARIAAITKSHKRSQKINLTVSYIDENTWHVQSRGNRPPYKVTCADTTCTDCPLFCPECKVCVHKYSCSCIDNLVRGNMCCHIHAVAFRQESSVTPLKDRFRNDTGVQQLVHTLTQEPSSVGNISHRVAFESRLAVLQDLVKSASDETAGSLLGSLDRIITVLKADIKSHQQFDENSLSTTKSANENCKRQRQFFSVKKTSARASHSWRGPSNSEIAAITEGLLHGESVSTGTDHTYTSITSLPERSQSAETAKKRKKSGECSQAHHSSTHIGHAE